jgi:O-acetyl-ADP-ribose deacetylase (regulator of RNase III)
VIKFVRGDILAADVEVLVNPVNCVGVMGAGLAAQVRRAYPPVFQAYREACMRGELDIGKLLACEGADGRLVVNLPTKRNWRDSSRLPWIAQGLGALRVFLLEHAPTRAAIPALGCGLDGLAWTDVEPLIRAYLIDIDPECWVYPPPGRLEPRSTP